MIQFFKSKEWRRQAGRTYVRVESLKEFVLSVSSVIQIQRGSHVQWQPHREENTSIIQTSQLLIHLLKAETHSFFGFKVNNSTYTTTTSPLCINIYIQVNIEGYSRALQVKNNIINLPEWEKGDSGWSWAVWALHKCCLRHPLDPNPPPHPLPLSNMGTWVNSLAWARNIAHAIIRMVITIRLWWLSILALKLNVLLIGPSLTPSSLRTLSSSFKYSSPPHKVYIHTHMLYFKHR